MSAEPVAVSPCGWRWLDSWIFRRRVPSYSTPSEWGPVYDRATLDAAVAAAVAQERERWASPVKQVRDEFSARYAADTSPGYKKWDAARLVVDALLAEMGVK